MSLSRGTSQTNDIVIGFGFGFFSGRASSVIGFVCYDGDLVDNENPTNLQLFDFRDFVRCLLLNQRLESIAIKGKMTFLIKI